MTENELIELISRNVRESILSNKETVAAGLVNIGQMFPLEEDDRFLLDRMLLDYTADISVIICIAMSGILSDAGILDIHSDEK